MSSPGRASNSSRQTSAAPSSESSYLSVPSRRGSLAQQQHVISRHSAAGASHSKSSPGTWSVPLAITLSKPSSRHVILSRPRGSQHRDLGYVSPYPPLHAQMSASSAANPIAGIAKVRTTVTSAQSERSAASTTASQEEEDEEDEDEDEDEEDSDPETVREYNFHSSPSSSMQQIEASQAMFDASNITQVRPNFPLCPSAHLRPKLSKHQTSSFQILLSFIERPPSRPQQTDTCFEMWSHHQGEFATMAVVANECDRQAQKLALIEALNEHRINTLGGLRRIERIFATLGSSDLTQPMTAACTIFFPSPNLMRSETLLSLTETMYIQGCTTSTPTASSPKSAP